MGEPAAPGQSKDPVNQVRLTGRVSGAPQERELPSGDRLVQLRVVVPRAGEGQHRGGARVDTIDVTCWSARTRGVALRLGDGDSVELGGALRRRFFRAGGAASSRYDVEVHSIRRLR